MADRYRICRQKTFVSRIWLLFRFETKRERSGRGRPNINLPYIKNDCNHCLLLIKNTESKKEKYENIAYS